MNKNTIQKIGVVGAGAWGTALASAFARAGRDIKIWVRSDDVAQSINTKRRNEKYLPGVELPPGIAATSALAQLQSCDAILLAVPSQQTRAACGNLKTAGIADKPIILCAKGIELDTDLLLHEVIAECMGSVPVCLISGPNFADEVAKGLPTATTLACVDEQFGRAAIQAIGSPAFRPYFSADIIGVALGGAVKNVMAIASGIVIGRGLGENARAALITRGLKEMGSFAAQLGAKPQSLMGLSGMGDLMLTCYGSQSRNFRYGVLLGQGRSPQEAQQQLAATVEGVATSRAASHLARAKKIDMPICFGVEAIIHHGRSIDEIMQALMQRPFRDE